MTFSFLHLAIFSILFLFLISITAYSSDGKEFTCNAGDSSSIPGLGRSTEGGIEYPLQYFWASFVAQLVKNPPAMGKIWVWSLGWGDPWRRERLSTPVFWPREFQGLTSPWGHKESDTAEWLSLSLWNYSLYNCLYYVFLHTYIIMLIGARFTVDNIFP